MADKVKQLNTLVTAHAKALRIAPRKMRLVTNLLKGLPVSQALVQLQFVNKKAAPMLSKLIKSAVANAEHNFALDPARLYIQEITCDMGPVLKRTFPRARGSAFVIRRKLSHVHVTLAVKAGKIKSAGIISKEEKAKDLPPQTTASAILPAAQEAITQPAAVKKQVRKTTAAKPAKPESVPNKRKLFKQDE